MADAQADPTVTFVVTYGHRPACTSQKSNGHFASSTEVVAAVNALGDRYSPAARPDGKYVLDVGHHIHIAEVCSPQHGVWELTDGGGGAEQPVVAATNPASLWKDNHFSYLRGRMVGGTLGLEFVCGPENTSAPTLAPACTQGDTLYSLSITSTPTPPPTTVEYVANPSVETDLTGWTGLYNKSSRSARVAGGFDGSFALRCWNGGTSTATVGVVDKPHWVAGSTVAGRTYTASAWASAQVSGERLSLVIKELTASKAVVGSSSVAVTPAPGGWVLLSTTYTATRSGDSLAFYVTGAKVPAGQGFLADLLGLTAPSP
jgi:hypothetical protein